MATAEPVVAVTDDEPQMRKVFRRLLRALECLPGMRALVQARLVLER